jgi:hypothetical protein
MKTVTFGMVWQVFGKQTINLPDNIDTTDEDAVKNYIQEQWDNIPLPTESDYIPESDEFDELTDIEISDDHQMSLPIN